MISLAKLRETNPLVICMTNDVVQNYTANGMVAIGTSPAMALQKEDLSDLLKYASALLVNIGTVTEISFERFKAACEIANRYGVPIVLDPVAAGASAYRLNVCKYLIEHYTITVVRGNASEVGALIGEAIAAKGVDSAASDDIGYLAQQAAAALGTAVVITGVQDAVCAGGDDSRVRILSNGSAMMPKVIGTGCLLGAVVAAFVGVDREDMLHTLEYCMSAYNVAGELAEKRPDAHLPGTYQIEFLNALYTVTDADVEALVKAEDYVAHE